MRLIILFSILFFSIKTSAQTIAVKCDSFQLVFNSKQALIYKKNKTGLYDVEKGEFIIKPTKNTIMHLDRYNMVLVFDKERLRMYTINEGNLVSRLVNKYGYTIDLSFPDTQIDSLKNKYVIGQYLMESTQSNASSQYLTPNQFKDLPLESKYRVIALSDEEIIINNSYLHNYSASWGYMKPLDFGYSKSGLYSLTNKKWLIPPKYANCTQIDSFIYCQNYVLDFEVAADGSEYFGSPGFEITYDIYVKRSDDYVLKFGAFKKLDAFSLIQLYAFDSVVFLSDEEHFLAYKNTKVGLYQFDLESPSDQVLTGFKPTINKLLPPEFDFIVFDSNAKVFMALQQNQISFWREYQLKNELYQAELLLNANSSILWGKSNNGRSVCLVDNNFVRLDTPTFINSNVNVNSIIQKNKFDLMRRNCLGVELLKDDKLLVINYRPDLIDPFAEPLRSLIYPDEDSIIYDIHYEQVIAVYPPADLGYFNSGIYDLKNKKWLVAPTNRIIKQFGDRYLIESLEKNERGEVVSISYSVMKTNGEYLVERISPQQILNDQEMYLKLFLGDSATSFPDRSIYRHEINMYENHFNYSIKEFQGKHYYVKDANQKWSVYRPISNLGYLNTEEIIAPKDFVHYNPTINYAFWLDEDFIYFEIKDSIYSIKMGDGKLILNYQIDKYRDYGLQFDLRLSTANDSVKCTTGYFDDEPYFETLTITFNKDEIIINEPQMFDNVNYADGSIYELDYMYPEFDYSVFKFFDAQTSSIWIKEEGVWLKRTPYYAAIDALPFGYVVKTGDYNEVVDLYKKTFNSEKGSIVVLDSNLKAMSFFDYFDFEWYQVFEFGIALSTDAGRFLVNRHGEIITSAEWDKFEMEDGRVKAIKFSADYYEYYYEFEGESEADYYEKVAYFDL